MSSRLKDSVTKSCNFISRVKHQKTAYNAGIPARLRTIRPKPIDILAVGIVTHHVCLQNLKAGVAHVITNDDTETRRLLMNLLHNCITQLFRDLRDAHL